MLVRITGFISIFKDIVENSFRKKITFLCLIVVLVFGDVGLSVADTNNTIYTNNPVMAIVDGESIRLDDLKDAGIQEALIQLYEMQERVLKQRVLQKLLKNHPELQKDKLPDISQEDIAQFYNTTPGVREMGRLDQMKGEIRQFLEKNYRDSFYESRYKIARDKGWLVDYLKAPNDFQVVAKIGTATLFFEDKAENPRKVFLLEYSDFQCPFCKRVQPTLGKLRQNYADKVQFGYRHFPLPFHKEAKDMAEAAECAGDQGKFWDLQAGLYGASGVIHRNEMTRYAERAGVKNVRAFQLCMDKGKYKSKIEKDIEEGVKTGVQGTPSFILGVYNAKTATVTGEIFSGAVPEEEFVRKIKKYIAVTEGGANLASVADVSK